MSHKRGMEQAEIIDKFWTYHPYMMQFTRFSNAVRQSGVEDEYPYCTYSLTAFADIPSPGGNNPQFLGQSPYLASLV